MGFPILVRWHLYIELGPRSQDSCLTFIHVMPQLHLGPQNELHLNSTPSRSHLTPYRSHRNSMYPVQDMHRQDLKQKGASTDVLIDPLVPSNAIINTLKLNIGIFKGNPDQSLYNTIWLMYLIFFKKFVQTLKMITFIFWAYLWAFRGIHLETQWQLLFYIIECVLIVKGCMKIKLSKK